MTHEMSRWLKRRLAGLRQLIQLAIDDISGQTRRHYQKLRRQLETLQTRVEKLQTLNSRLKRQNSTLTQQNQALTRRLESFQQVATENQHLNQQIQQLTTAQAASQRTIADLQLANSSLENEIQTLLQQADAETQQLAQQNQALITERDRLQRLIDSEIQLLKKRNQQLIKERDDLQLQVLEQEEHIDELLAERQIDHAINSEIQQIQKRNQQLARERDDLQLKVWEQEQQINELLAYIAQTEEDLDSEDAADLPLIETADVVDLSTLTLALVGGHEATRRGVIEALSTEHGLKHWVEVPPFSNISAGRSKVKAKIQSCDLIVMITGYMSHKLTKNVYGLKESGALTGEIVPLSCRGKSGVIREVLKYVAQRKA
ncbi:MAG: hypothetical protein ACTS3T_13270 [Almyronema sp.]